MNLVNIGNKEMTMSSFEISQLVNQRHDNVKRTIETLGKKGIFTLPQIEEVSNPGMGPKAIWVYSLCKRDSLIVVAQLCPEFTAVVVDRWQQLEEAAAKPAIDPANFSRMQLIELAMQAETERLVLEEKVNEMQPKVEALEKIAEADGAMNCTVAAKTLQIHPKQFFKWLRENNWIYRRPGGSGNVAYQDKIKSGYLTHKVTTIHREDGSEKVVEQVLVTGKGLTKISQALVMQ